MLDGCYVFGGMRWGMQKSNRKVIIHVQKGLGDEETDRCRPEKVLLIQQVFPKRLLGQALY